MGNNHHIHATSIKRVNNAFKIGIAINLFYVIIEFGAGFYYNSLSLISDAGHNLSDVAALAMALLAYRLSEVKANDRFTYGYRKSTILVSLINSIVLFILIGGILRESIVRINNPIEVQGFSISIIASIGIAINAVSAFLFFKDKESDLNIKGAYLHLLADAAVSLGVVISGIFISIFQINWLDLIMSLIIVVVIFYSTWSLFKDSLFLTLDGVPKELKLDKVIYEIKQINEVIDVHHLHVWAISTTQNAMTAHIIIKQDSFNRLEEIKNNIKQNLEHINIQHATLEFETENENCVNSERKQNIII